MKRSRTALNRHPLQRLIAAVAHAAHDVQLEHDPENPHEILHFFDTDFLYRAVYGYRVTDVTNGSLVHEFGSGHPEAADSAHPIRGGVSTYQLLLSSLINYSRFDKHLHLPKIRSLQPHLAEWTDLVLDQDPPHRPENRQATLEALGTQTAFKDIADSLDRNGPQPSAEVGVFLDAVQEFGPSLFIAFDLTFSDASARVSHFLDLGLGQSTEFDYGSRITSTGTFEQVESLLRRERFRGQSPGARARAHLVDAAAISMLVEGVGERPRSRDGKRIIGRYYTETAPIRRILQDVPEMLGLCTYPQDLTTEAWPDSSHSVFRDEYYYLVRLLIPSLSFDPEADRDSFLIREILSISVAALKARSPRELYGVIDRYSAGSDSLGSLIESVTDLSFADQIWSPWITNAYPWLKTAVQMEKVDEHFTEVSSFGVENAKEIHQQVEQRVAGLQNAVADIANFSDIYVDITPQIARQLPLMELSAKDPAFLSDAVGLAKWSLSRDEEATKVARQLLADAIKASKGNEQHAAETIALNIASILARAPAQDPVGPQEIAALLILYGTRQYREVREHTGDLTEKLMRRVRETGDVVGKEADRYVVIGVCRALSTFHEWTDEVALEDTHYDENDAVLRVAGVQAELDRIASAVPRFEQSPTFALAGAYVNFYAWYALNPGIEALKAADRVERSIGESLLRRSFAMIGVRLAVEPRQSALYPWVVNQALYSAAVSATPQPVVSHSIGELAEELIALGRKHQVGLRWSYRFSDTVAVYFYYLAKRSLETRTERGDSGFALGDPRELGEKALEWIVRAESEMVHDYEIQRHRDQIEVFLSNLA